MNSNSWLTSSQQILEAGGIATARLDCLVLLEDVTRKDRAWLLAHPEFMLTSSQQAHLQRLLERRSRHEPLAYVRGKTEFYGREFKVSKDTLEPRPESETMIDLLKEIVSDQRERMLVDVGTGSGALAITAKLELPQLDVQATEISKAALRIARTNAKTHQADITFYEGDLMSPLQKPPHIIIANLPYVPDHFTINPSAMQEPRIAIFGGPDGLDYYRQLFQQIAKNLQFIAYVLTESMPPQHESLASIAHAAGLSLWREDDFIQVFCPTGSEPLPVSP